MYTYVVLLCLMIVNSFGDSPTNQIILGYQDSIGQYSFGYSAPKSARSEIRLADGFTRGAFSYIDDSGVIQTAKYTADSVNGFRIEATNLPEPPNPIEDTPEVKAARLEHFRAYAAALKNSKAKNLPEFGSIFENLSDKMVISKIITGNGKKIDDEIIEKHLPIAQSIDQISSQLPHQKQTKLNRYAEVKQETPLMKTRLILPKSNVNIENRIELKTMDLSGSGASFLQSMSQDKAERSMTIVAQSKMMNDDPTTGILHPVQKHPMVSSHTEYLHLVPLYYF